MTADTPYMKKLILIVIGCCSIPVWSQSYMESELLKEKSKIEANVKNYEGYVKSNLEYLEKEKKKLADNQEKLKSLEEYEQKFADSRAFALADIHNKIESLPVTKKIGKTGNFYKCLRDSLEDDKYLKKDACYNRYRPKLSVDENKELENWNQKTGMSLDNVQKTKNTLPDLIKKSEERVGDYEKNYQNSLNQVDYLKQSLKVTETRISELKLIPGNQHFMKCNSTTPVINLEEEVPFPNAEIKGPFHEVPRDNQDGLGTCYANAAKNLLVGVSSGEDIASFLDLALHYKNSNGAVSKDGLDAGNSCATLDAVKERGYCPQTFSPMESGERNHIGEGLFNLAPDNYLATNVNLLRNFLNGLSDFEQSNSEVTADVLARADSIIKTLKSNPDITLPLPVVRIDIPDEWKIKEAHAMKKLDDKISADKFVEEYRDAYRKFYPKYIKGVIAGKNLDEIFEIYKDTMKDFLTKYDLNGNLDEFKRIYKMKAKYDSEDPKLKTKLSESIKFLKNIMNKNDMSDESFYEFCSASGADALRFLGSLQPVIEKIRENKINEDKLFDNDGKFRSAYELMQLTVAPSCLNAENRKKIAPFACDNGYNFISAVKNSEKSKSEKIKMMRERVVLSLIQGYPLGNSYPTSANSGHINTIVGLRFNPQTNVCEYRIRESQTGTSFWKKEEDIFDNIRGLTEIRRLK